MTKATVFDKLKNPRIELSRFLLKAKDKHQRFGGGVSRARRLFDHQVLSHQESNTNPTTQPEYTGEAECI